VNGDSNDILRGFETNSLARNSIKVCVPTVWSLPTDALLPHDAGDHQASTSRSQRNSCPLP
jgi:hypothetical protein